MSALFLGKRFNRRDIAALALAYGGILLVFLHDVRLEGEGVPLGAMLVFVSAVCYAAYLVMSGELVKRIGAIRLTSYAMCVSTVAVFLQFLVLNPLGSLQQPAPVYWLSLINGLLCTVLPVFATMLAVERIGAGRTSMAAMVGPVATIALAYVFLGETISSWQVAGTALVLAGVYVLSRSTTAAALGRSAGKESLMKAKAIVVRAHGGPDVLDYTEVDVPDPAPTRCGSGSTRSGSTTSTCTTAPGSTRVHCRTGLASRARASSKRSAAT